MEVNATNRNRMLTLLIAIAINGNQKSYEASTNDFTLDYFQASERKQ